MSSVDAYLSGAFPPTGPIPLLTASDRALLLDLAQGAPGDVVKPGLFPRARTKLARLALAADGHWDPARLVQILDDATDGETPRPYFPHDVFLCALVHPSIDQEQRRTVVWSVVHQLGAYQPGARIRRTAWRLARWAVEHGHLDPSDWIDEMEERLLLRHGRRERIAALDAEPTWSSRDEPVFTDELWLHGPHDTRTVRVAGDLGTDGERWFTVDLSAIPWPTRSILPPHGPGDQAAAS